MFDLVKKINIRLNKGNYDILNIDKQSQIITLNKYERKNMSYIERSYAQYKCQMENKSIIIIALYNIVSAIIIFPFIVLRLIKGNKILEEYSKQDTAVSFVINENLIQNSLKEKYNFKKGEMKYNLKFKDIKFFIKEVVKKRNISFYFYFKIIFKMALYRYNIEKYNPMSFIVSTEYSFTSSIMTKFCHYNNIKHINIMHGDKIFFIRDSFVKFDKFYLWDKHYLKLFIEMKADSNQFLIELPKIFLNKAQTIEKNSKRNIKNLTYYLQIGEKEKLNIIKDNLFKIKHIFNIIIRPHPIYCDMDVVKEIFKDFTIENPRKVKIYDSINETNYVVSLYSTVLYQAYLCNKNIIIDDCINIMYYNKLRELDYIITSKNHIKLSEVIKVKDERDE